MSWSIGFDSTWQRDIGYGVPATCDHPWCDKQIDRGLSYVCGSHPCGGDVGCGLYFCELHLTGYRKGAHLCTRCMRYRSAYKAKPDVDEWAQHKLTDESWAKWRAENPEWVAEQLSACAQQSVRPDATPDDTTPAAQPAGRTGEHE